MTAHERFSNVIDSLTGEKISLDRILTAINSVDNKPLPPTISPSAGTSGSTPAGNVSNVKRGKVLKKGCEHSCHVNIRHTHLSDQCDFLKKGPNGKCIQTSGGKVIELDLTQAQLKVIMAKRHGKKQHKPHIAAVTPQVSSSFPAPAPAAPAPPVPPPASHYPRHTQFPPHHFAPQPHQPYSRPQMPQYPHMGFQPGYHHQTYASAMCPQFPLHLSSLVFNQTCQVLGYHPYVSMSVGLPQHPRAPHDHTVLSTASINSLASLPFDV